MVNQTEIVKIESKHVSSQCSFPSRVCVFELVRFVFLVLSPIALAVCLDAETNRWIDAEGRSEEFTKKQPEMKTTQRALR